MDESSRGNFFKQFDSSIVPHIFEFGKQLENADADVMVIMARKAVCFVETLQQLGLTNINSFVTSNRIMDMNLTWLKKDAKVILVDDALISGSTLRRTRDTFEVAGITDVKTLVFCVNTTWWSPDLVTPDFPYLRVNEEQSLRLCASIVHAISTVPRPYGVDFPLFRDLRLPVDGLDHLATLTGWKTYDLSTSLQESINIKNLTMIPGQRTLSRLDDVVGWNLSRHSQLVKIRLFGNLVESERGLYKFQIHPIVALDPLLHKDLNNLFNSIMATTNAWKSALPGIAPETFKDEFVSASSQLRLVQYILSHHLYRLWLSQVDQVMNSDQSPKSDQQNIQYLFPPPLVPIVNAIAQEEIPHFGMVPAIHDDTRHHVSASNGEDSIVDSSYVHIQDRLTKPFLEMYRVKEIPARRLALEHGAKALYDPQFKPIMDRLNEGLSLNEIRALLHDLDNSYDVSNLVSLYLDSAIDHGLVVPITADDGETIFRGYRHGEDILFALSEMALMCECLSAFEQESGLKSVSRLWVEKIFVLLVRVGVQQVLLNLNYASLGARGTAGIRFTLHGATVQVNSPSLYKYNPDGEVTNLLVNEGYLQVDTETDRYSVRRVPENTAKETTVQWARGLGTLLARVLSPRDASDAILDTDGLTLIATCLYPNDAAAALAAEIDIFHRKWSLQWDQYTDLPNSGRAKALYASQLFANLQRDSVETAYKAINSGRWKFKAFLDDTPWSKIREVAQSLDDALYRTTWMSYWSRSVQPEDTDEDVRRLIIKEGIWCIKANIVVRLLELSSRYLIQIDIEDKRQRRGHESSSSRLAGQIETYCGYLDDLEAYDTDQTIRDIALQSVADRNAGELDAIGLIRFAFAEIERLLSAAQELKEEVDTGITTFGKPTASIQYENALFIEFRSLSRNDDYVHDVIDAVVLEFRAKARDDTVRIVGVGNPEGPIGGSWIAAAGATSRSWLVRISQELCKRLAFDVDMNLILIANLDRDDILQSRPNTSDFRGINFWNRVSFIKSSLPPEWHGLRFAFAIPSSRELSKAVAIEASNANFICLSDEFEEFTVPHPFPKTFVKGHYYFERGDIVMEPKNVDIGIITVVTEETRAVIDAKSGIQNLQEMPGRLSRRIFYEGSLPAAGGEAYSVVCVQQLQPNTRSVGPAFEALRQEYAPRLIVMLGIAGGISSKLDLCDVVIADQIVDYGKLKETDAGISRRGEAYKIPGWLAVNINRFFVKYEEPAFLNSSSPTAPTAQFRVFRGPIGSGEAVVASLNSEIRSYLLSYNDKLLAVETEAAGLAQAIYENELARNNRVSGYLVIRGISDHADPDKSDSWRNEAAQNAMQVLRSLLEGMTKQSDLS